MKKRCPHPITFRSLAGLSNLLSIRGRDKPQEADGSTGGGSCCVPGGVRGPRPARGGSGSRHPGAVCGEHGRPREGGGTMAPSNRGKPALAAAAAIAAARAERSARLVRYPGGCLRGFLGARCPQAVCGERPGGSKDGQLLEDTETLGHHSFTSQTTRHRS